MDTTFGGHINWSGCINAQSIASDMKADQLEKQILEANPTFEDWQKSLASEMVYMLFCFAVPPKVTWQEGEPQTLVKFAEFIGKWQALSPTELWAQYTEIPYTLVKAWRIEFKKAQGIYYVPIAQLPTDALTTEQQEALKDKASPLA